MNKTIEFLLMASVRARNVSWQPTTSLGQSNIANLQLQIYNDGGWLAGDQILPSGTYSLSGSWTSSPSINDGMQVRWSGGGGKITSNISENTWATLSEGNVIINSSSSTSVYVSFGRNGSVIATYNIIITTRP